MVTVRSRRPLNNVSLLRLHAKADGTFFDLAVFELNPIGKHGGC